MRSKDVLITVALLIGMTCCSEKEATEAESEKERVQRLLLSATWKIDNVMIDGVTETTLFQSMTLKFNTNTYTATHGEFVWKASGTWQLADNGSTFLKDGNVTVTIDQINESQLTISLFWDEDALGGGRMFSISGEHIFALKP